MINQESSPTLIDLFCGCGGVTQGFKNKGFRVLGAVEWDPITAKTYSANHPEVSMYVQDIREVDPVEMLAECNIDRGELTVLSTCAPCQPFSRHTRSAALRTGNRTKLILEMIRFIAVLQPQYAILENVPGLSRGKNKAILERLITILRDNLGYTVTDPKIVNAVDYGVPQFRKRLILLISREEVDFKIPEPTHVSPECAEDKGKRSWRTVGDAFKGVTRLAAGQTSRQDPLHKARNHTDLSIQRLKHIPANGGSRHSLPEFLQLDCHKNTSGYNDVYGRLDRGQPANTLTTGCTNFSRGRFAHPTANRAITPREAARLQSFEDSYEFKGTYEQISAQIGNAVPVLLAETFAEYLSLLSSGT